MKMVTGATVTVLFALTHSHAFVEAFAGNRKLITKITSSSLQKLHLKENELLPDAENGKHK